MNISGVENKARLAIIIFILAVLLLLGLSVALYLRAHGEVSSSSIFVYLFSYQIIALVFGLALMFLLVRWLLRPYRRMVEAARGSPVHASTAMTESEFVVDTFQALIEHLQAKEKELAQLHALERRRAERSERFSERLVANLPSGLVTVDAGGMVTTINSHALKALGRLTTGGLVGTVQDEGAEMLPLGLHARDFFSTAPRIAELIAACLNTGKTFRREEARVVLPDGRARYLGLSISPITDATHKIEGALCLLTDITEVLELRERMKLQENLANLGEMAAGLAHEFKNSLATIHGYVQLLELQLRAAPPDEQQETLTATLNEVRLLARLVTDFLNFARPQQLALDEVKLRSLIDDCASEVRPQLQASDIEMVIEGRFPAVAGDESLLRRVFVNLMRNAAEAIDPQSPIKRIAINGMVEVGDTTHYAHVRISDTGGGISNDDLPRIFIPFFTTKSRGYGIGLALVQKILIAHGGNVTVEKSDATGSTFHCRLPLAVPVESHTQRVN